jgi:hypothetical protein
MTNTKVTAKFITAGMMVRSPYLGNGRDFYRVVTAHIDAPGKPYRNHLVLTIAERPSSTWFNMNSKFEIHETADCYAEDPNHPGLTCQLVGHNGNHYAEGYMWDATNTIHFS